MIWTLHSMTAFTQNPALSSSTDYTADKGGSSVQVSITKYHGLGGLNDRNLVFTVLEARSLVLRGRCGQLLVRALVSGCQWLPFHCVSSHGLSLEYS